MTGNGCLIRFEYLKQLVEFGSKDNLGAAVFGATLCGFVGGEGSKLSFTGGRYPLRSYAGIGKNVYNGGSPHYTQVASASIRKGLMPSSNWPEC